MSYSELMREMGMGRQAVAEGIAISLDRGYIERVQAGSLRGHRVTLMRRSC